MGQCPVCKAENGDRPVCPVCGFDTTCDYERFPTLCAGIPRNLKARALQKAGGVKNDIGKTAEPIPKPADNPPVSLLSQAEIGRLTFRKGLYALLFSVAVMFFMAFIMASVGSVSASKQRPPDGMLAAIAVTAGSLVLFFVLLKKTLKKMKPDEWVWKKQNTGQWIVLPKDPAGTGRKKKMLASLLLFNLFGWAFGSHAFYEGHYLWGLLHLALLLGGAVSSGSLQTGMGIVLVLIYFIDLSHVMGLPPEFDKGSA